MSSDSEGLARPKKRQRPIVSDSDSDDSLIIPNHGRRTVGVSFNAFIM